LWYVQTFIPAKEDSFMAQILVIDDDAMLQRVLKEILLFLGHEVRQAFDGKEGVRLCRESPPDLVLTDILMPEQDGLQTIRELRRLCPEVKIIAMSGGSLVWPGIDSLSFASRFGARHVLHKPFAHHELQAALNAVACV
jgi:CheY-like chemotaxis protein